MSVPSPDFLLCSILLRRDQRRTVCPLNTDASLPVAMNADLAVVDLLQAERRRRPADVDLVDITWVSVGAGPPVAVGFALRSYCFMNA